MLQQMRKIVFITKSRNIENTRFIINPFLYLNFSSDLFRVGHKKAGLHYPNVSGFFIEKVPFFGKGLLWTGTS
jgi:hypothetical protein